MNRRNFFLLGSAGAVVFLIVGIIYWAGGMPPDHVVHVKHGILFLGLAVISALFAVVNRPLKTLP
jgi:Ca2+/Na+ antiporter